MQLIAKEWQSIERDRKDFYVFNICTKVYLNFKYIFEKVTQNIALLGISISIYSYASIRVTKAITTNDYEITKLLNTGKECSNLNTYEKESFVLKVFRKHN